ncbi:unnamed protein product [Phytophthora fragariaefolia]|uniref:GPI ethanolamine phosphate transferase 1 n=1 Tax=Phytophthora fragariaefolia TaxID=1490495 RepID=A0A9W6WTZ6_9STRA|nr:unnamed protein product [Phytophthora fragariaefolia]
MGSSINRLLLLGVAFHALAVLSVFDVYFQSTVVSSIPSANYTASAPAKRVVIFTLDGCRVDKLYKAVAHYADRYDLDPGGSDTAPVGSASRKPFLGNVMRQRGSWGVSHNHAPTESRPCHVALTAGMYEDPHAVTKSWKQHPVPFDSVFNQSSSAFIYGNKDVAPMLARHAPQATEEHYSAKEEGDMVREDTTLLDVWAYRKMKALFARGTEMRDPELYRKLHNDRLVIYCHFLGTDLTGPKYGADSREYLENIAVVDELIENTEKMIDAYYGNDGRTAYVVNSDHGMDLRGDHGDKDPSKTRTILIAWGAGVRGPITTSNTSIMGFDFDLPTQSRVEVQSRLKAQENEEETAAREWATLMNFTRKDVMQTDVAALISALAGLPYPRNSVGVLPFTYLADHKYRATALRANAMQLYQHALRIEEVKRARRGFLFVPYSSLHYRIPELKARIDEALDSISADNGHAIHNEAQRVVELSAQEIIAISRSAIMYYQKYDWWFLLGSAILGYVGLALIMTVAYLHPQKFRLRWVLVHVIDPNLAATVAVVMWWRFLADSPPTHYLYALCPLIFWNFIWKQRSKLYLALAFPGRAVWRQWSVQLGLTFLCLEFVVLGYQYRPAFSILFVLIALWPWAGSGKRATKSVRNTRMKQGLEKLMPSSFYWSVSCLLIAIFPCLPSDYDENMSFVRIGALLGLVAAFVTIRSLSNEKDKSYHWKLSLIPAFASVLVALFALQRTTNYVQNKEKLSFSLVATNWIVIILPPIWLIIQKRSQSKTSGFRVLTPNKESDLEHQQPGDDITPLLAIRLVAVQLALAPALIMLSTSYEVIFYVVFCCALVSWLLLEADQSVAGGIPRSRDVQRALMLLLFAQIAFFGTSSVASMTSFQMPSTRRFLTEPAPSVAQVLVALKILVPFVVVACAFRIILVLPSGAGSSEFIGKSRWMSRYYLLVFLLVDFLATHFLFLVNNEGSWKQMGNSIAEFCIINGQVALLPTIQLLSRVFVADLEFIDKECFTN